MRNSSILAIVFTHSLVFGGCSSKEPSEPASGQAATPEPTPELVEVVQDPATQALEIYKLRCTVCHGEGGKGDGPGSASLVPKPRDFSSPDWQKSVTDEHIEKIIVYGGIAVGKAAVMPGNPDLDAKPEVVSELRAVVRKLGQ
jgi:mono/diheme cytochrome c family protein